MRILVMGPDHEAEVQWFDEAASRAHGLPQKNAGGSVGTGSIVESALDWVCSF